MSKRFFSELSQFESTPGTVTYQFSQMPAAKKSKSAPTKSTFVVKAKKTKKNTKYFDAPSKSLPQVKNLDWTINMVGGTGGSMANLVSMLQGTSNSTRIGQKIQIISIEYDVSVSCATASLATVATYPTNSNQLKFSIVYDKQPNGTAATYGQIFQATGQPAAYEFRNIDNIDRFDVLSTDVAVLNSNGQNSVRLHRYIPCSKEVRYNGGNVGNVTDVMTGNLQIAIADENGTGLVQTEVYGKLRVRYIDN